MTAVRRVLVVEDDPAVRRLIEILLSTEPDFELVATTATAEEGITLAGTLQPDLIVLDNQLDGPLKGLQAAPRIKAACPAGFILLCTALDLARAAEREPSLDGYLRKNDLADLVEVARTLLDG